MAASTTPTARKRQSRASRAQQLLNAEFSDTEKAVYAPVTGTAAADAGKPTLAAVPSETPRPQPQATPALKPQPKPTASVDLGAKPVTYWFPSAKLSDGTTVSCPHARYGHEQEAGAKRCIAQLVAQRGHRVG